MTKISVRKLFHNPGPGMSDPAKASAMDRDGIAVNPPNALTTLGIYGHVIGDSQRNTVDKVGELLRPEFCAQMPPN
jgi:hypothetical protein